MEFYISKDEDIAVVWVKIISAVQIPEIDIAIPEWDKEVFIYGYPCRFSETEKAEKAARLRCIVNRCTDKTFFIDSIQSLENAENAAVVNTGGYSGSGIFEKDETRIYLIGIESQLRTPDGVFGQLRGYKISIFNELLAEKKLPVLEIIKSRIKTFRPAGLKDRLHHLLERHKLFGGRDRELGNLNAFITGHSSGYLFITGKSGFGKTALLAHLLFTLEKCKERVAYHFISRSDSLAGEDFALRSLCQQLSGLHSLNEKLPDKTIELRSLYTQLLSRPPDNKHRIFVILDGIDEAEGWKVGADLFPSNLPEGVFVIFSARETGRDWLTELELKTDQVSLETLKTLGTVTMMKVMHYVTPAFRIIFQPTA